MILKSFQLKNYKKNSEIFFLFYGNNRGHKLEEINYLINKNKGELIKYDENEILKNENEIIESILTKSLFQEKRIILVTRTTDKILKTIELLNGKKLDDILIILNSDNLDKRSKLRSFFEKNNNCICIPFYPDNHQTLSKIASDFFRKKEISASQANINILIEKSNGDRQVLLNELDKIENFCKSEKKLTHEHITKLINLAEDYSISELIDSCLSNNKKKIINILNENHFSNEDCVLITRTFLNKSKKILNLSQQYEINKNMDFTISSAKPPIFWKDKEITKQQISKWPPQKIKNLIIKLNKLELLVKKNVNNSINHVKDFILNQVSA